MDDQPAAQEGFTIEGLRRLVVALHEDPSSLEKDWREAFDQLELTDEDRAFLEDCPSELHDYLQRAFAAAAERIRQGGEINIKVVKDYEQDRRELHLVIPQDEEGGPENVAALWFKVVCCDANCRNWHWCWKTPRPPTRV